MPKTPIPLVVTAGLLLVATATVFALTATAEGEGFYADAGDDQTVECTSPSGASVTLDGSGSHAAETNDSIGSAKWYLGDTLLGNGLVVNTTLPLGTHVVRLHLMNSTDDTLRDNVTIRIVDTTAPTLHAGLVGDPTPWPPNHKMRTFETTVSATDLCGSATWKLVGATSDEPDNAQGDGNTVGDVQGADVGSQDTSFSLRAERAGPGDGRTYTLTYEAVDQSGNKATPSVVVSVPHDMDENEGA